MARAANSGDFVVKADRDMRWQLSSLNQTSALTVISREGVTLRVRGAQSNTYYYVILQGITRYYASLRAITGTITVNILLYSDISCVM